MAGHKYNSFASATILAADIVAFWKSSSSAMRTTTFTGLVSAIQSAVSSAFTSSAVVPSATPTAGQILVGNAGNTAFANVSTSGDVTLASTGAMTIGADKVLYSKIQNVSAASKLLGRGDSGAGDPQEITLGTNLTMSGTTLNAATGVAGNVIQGSNASATNKVFVSGGSDKTRIETPVTINATTGAMDGYRDVIIPGYDFLTLTAVMSGGVVTNQGATSMMEYTLPTAAAGLVFTFIVQDTDGLKVIAAAGDTVRIGPVESAVAGFASSTTIGETVTFVAINTTEWMATCYIGAWTVT